MPTEKIRPTYQQIIRVLIVEDDLTSRAILRHLLPDSGIEVVFAEDGLSAVIEYSRRPYDLIILDWSLPYMNGGQFLRRVDSMVKYGGIQKGKRNTNFLIFSSSSIVQLKIPRTEHLNYLGFVSKSHSPVKIKKSLEKHTRLAIA